MYPRVTAHALTLLALLTLAACGGGGGSNNSTGTTEAVAPPPEPVFTIVGSVDASLDAGANVFVDLAVGCFLRQQTHKDDTNWRSTPARRIASLASTPRVRAGKTC